MTRRIPIFATAVGSACIAFAALAPFASRSAEPIRIEPAPQTTPVDFATQIAPLLRANCIACHNEKKSEGGLSLESIPAMLKGGDRGPAIVPGKGASSLLLIAAAHREAIVMPPPDNIVGAKPLTPAELGLLKLWIDDVAAGKPGAADNPGPPREVHWQVPPAGYHPAFAAAVTPDGRYAACARGRRLCVYDLATGKPAAMLVDPSLPETAPSKSAPGSPLLAAHHDVVRSLAFDPTGDLLASGGFREVKLWRRPRASRIGEWTHDAPLRSSAVSPDGRKVAVGDEQGHIHVCDAADGKQLLTIAAHQDAVTGLAFATDGVLFSCSLDKSIKSWQADGKPAGRAITLPDGIETMVSIDERRRLITGDRRGMTLVWDIASLSRTSGEVPKPTAEIKAHGAAVTAAAAVAEKPSEFFTAGADGFVRRWDVKSNNKLAEFNNGAPVAALAVDGTGRRIAAAGSDTLKIWDEGGKSIASSPSDPRISARLAKLDADIVFTKALVGRSENDLKSYEGLIRAVTVTMDAVKAAEGERTKAEKARDEKKAALATLKAANDKSNKPEKPDKAKVEAAEKALATAETAVAVAGTVIERSKAVAERTAKRLAEAQSDLAAQKELLKKQEAARADLAKTSGPKIRSLAFAPDQGCLAAGCDDGAVHLFDAESGTPSQSFAEHSGAVRALVFTPRGTLLAGSADRRTSVWNVPSRWRLERVIGGLDRPDVLVDRVLSVDFSRDGTLLAAGGGVPSRSGEVKIFNVADAGLPQAKYGLVRTIEAPHSETVFAVRFSPTGESLATAGGDRLIKIFDARSGGELKRFAGHTAHVLSLAWKADGKLLVSAGADNVLKLWDVETGLLVRTMKGGVFGNRTYKSAVTGVSFIGESEEIVAVSGDGTVRLHRASSDHEIMTFTGSKGYQHAADATPDGKSVIAAAGDGTLRVWSGHQPQPRLSLTPD